MFWIFIALLFVTSFIWALASLKRELGVPRELRHAKKKLLKEKVLFKR